MKLSKRDKFLIDEAFEAGYVGIYPDSKKWLESDQYDTGDDMEDQLAQSALQVENYEIARLQKELAEYKNPKNWTRSYMHNGNLTDEHALYRPKLKED